MSNDRTAFIIAEMIKIGLEDGVITLTDDEFRHFVPVIMAEGNVDFLKAIAKARYKDTRKDVVIEFLNYIETLVIEGKKELKEGVHGSNC